MTTQYTSILKLALPVQGELSGTWGDVVNDNITSMVEEAIAGRAVIDSWTTNSHTLTSANGTTSESRCAMLEFTDTTVSLSGDATVICPTAAKIYICKNDAGQKVTIKTSAGTGVAIADGQTMFVFCDGTNVVEAVTSMSSLKLGTAVTSIEVTSILDEDDLVSDSATALATQQSIKAYVDSQVTAQDLDFGGDSGTGSVDLDSQSLTIAGTTNEIETSAADQTLTIGLPDAVTVTTSVTTPTVQVTDVKANDGTAAVSIADSTGQTTITDAVLTTADINGGTIDGTTIGATTATTGAFTTVTSSGNTTVSGQLVTDTISEETATAGVTVDGLLVKDTGIGVADASGTDVAGSDVTVRGGAGTGTGAGGELLFKVAPAGSTGSSVNALATGMKLDSTKALYVDTINELTSAAGVTIDSVLLKDDVVNATDIETSTISANDGTTAINIADSTGAVDIDTSLNVDGTITGDGLTVDGQGVIQTSSGTSLLTLKNTDASISGGEAISVDMVYGDTANSTSWRMLSRFAGNNLQFLSNIDDAGYNTRMTINENGDITFYETDGTTASFFYDADTGLTINNGQNARDFTVKSNNNANMLVVDGTNDVVNVNSSSLTGGDLNVNDVIRVSGAAPEIKIDVGSSGYYFSLSEEYSGDRAISHLKSVAGASFSGRFQFAANSAGGAYRELLRLDYATGATFNEGNADVNFQVKSVNQDNMLFVDAGNDQVSVNGNQNVANAVSGDNVGPKFVVEHSTATSIGILRNDTSIVSGNSIGSLGFYGTDTTSNTPRALAAVQAVAAGTHGAGDNPTELRFYTTPDNSETLTERVTITQGGEVQLATDSAFKTDSTATSATTQTSVYSFSATTYTGAKFLVCVTDSTATERYITELLVTHDGTTAVATEYGQVATDTALATFDVDISGGNVRLLATPASSNSMTFKVMSTQLLA